MGYIDLNSDVYEHRATESGEKPEFVFEFASQGFCRAGTGWRWRSWWGALECGRSWSYLGHGTTAAYRFPMESDVNALFCSKEIIGIM